MKKVIKLSLVGLAISTTMISAEEVKKVEPVKVEINQNDIKQLINMAGKQRMLSQRIVKDYLYLGKKIASNKAGKELDSSMKEFRSSLNKLKISLANDEETLNLIEFTEMSLDDLEEIIKEDYTVDNAQLAIDLSETLLEGSQYIVTSLEDKTKTAGAKIVNKAGKQRMLSQRIAKYYIAYQIGIKDKNTVDQMNAAVKEFQESLTYLKSYQKNTPEINVELNKVDKLWKIVHKFYLGIEKGGLPIIVYNTTNKITKKMNKITKNYEKI